MLLLTTEFTNDNVENKNKCTESKAGEGDQNIFSLVVGRVTLHLNIFPSQKRRYTLKTHTKSQKKISILIHIIVQVKMFVVHSDVKSRHL